MVSVPCKAASGVERTILSDEQKTLEIIRAMAGSRDEYRRADYSLVRPSPGGGG